jgi:protein MAK11
MLSSSFEGSLLSKQMMSRNNETSYTDKRYRVSLLLPSQPTNSNIADWPVSRSEMAEMDDDSTPAPVSHVLLAVGTYEGGIAAYEMDLPPGTPSDGSNDSSARTPTRMQMVFASPIHQGSVRSLSVAEGTKHLLLSTGYDEMMKLHDFSKHRTSCGEIRTPPHLGTPVCSAFAPPYVVGHQAQVPSTHCLIGFSGSNANEDMTGSTAEANGGKLVIYKKRDWSVQHVLNGHEGGIASISVHPTGKLALTGGINDGKLKLWDLERGRLAYSSIVGGATKSTSTAANTSGGGRKSKIFESIVSIVWSADGIVYGFCYGSHITVRPVETGIDLLDVELPSKVNQICFIQGKEGLFVAAACNDGSLPVLAVENIDGKNDASIERRAIMAIEPIDGPVAGVERFKCIQTISGYFVATANSAGVLSVMDLRGAVAMISAPSDTLSSASDNEDGDGDDSEISEDDDDDSKEFAVDIIDSVRIGSGARITCLVAWTAASEEVGTTDPSHTVDEKRPLDDPDKTPTSKKVKRFSSANKHEIVELDSEALEKARLLVSQAKKIQKRKNDRRTKMLSSK